MDFWNQIGSILQVIGAIVGFFAPWVTVVVLIIAGVVIYKVYKRHKNYKESDEYLHKLVRREQQELFERFVGQPLSVKATPAMIDELKRTMDNPYVDHPLTAKVAERIAEAFILSICESFSLNAQSDFWASSARVWLDAGRVWMQISPEPQLRASWTPIIRESLPNRYRFTDRSDDDGQWSTVYQFNREDTQVIPDVNATRLFASALYELSRRIVIEEYKSHPKTRDITDFRVVCNTEICSRCQKPKIWFGLDFQAYRFQALRETYEKDFSCSLPLKITSAMRDELKKNTGNPFVDNPVTVELAERIAEDYLIHVCASWRGKSGTPTKAFTVTHSICVLGQGVLRQINDASSMGSTNYSYIYRHTHRGAWWTKMAFDQVVLLDFARNYLQDLPDDETVRMFSEALEMLTIKLFETEHEKNPMLGTVPHEFECLHTSNNIGFVLQYRECQRTTMPNTSPKKDQWY